MKSTLLDLDSGDSASVYWDSRAHCIKLQVYTSGSDDPVTVSFTAQEVEVLVAACQAASQENPPAEKGEK